MRASENAGSRDDEARPARPFIARTSRRGYWLEFVDAPQIPLKSGRRAELETHRIRLRSSRNER
jgi:hypothetical protein